MGWVKMPTGLVAPGLAIQLINGTGRVGLKIQGTGPGRKI